MSTLTSTRCQCSLECEKGLPQIPKISPGLIFVRKVVLLGLYSGELILIWEACYRKEFCISKRVGLDNKNSLKQLKIANINSPWVYIREGLLSERFFASGIWGTYFREGLFFIYLFIFFFWGGGGGGRVGLLSEFYGIYNPKFNVRGPL